MAWENMTVGKRIGVGFGAVLIILAVLGVAAYLGVAGIVDNGREVIGGNKLGGSLVQREVDHLVWANQVNALLTDDKVTKLDVQLDPRKCAFGKWYYGDGRREAEKMVPDLKPFLEEIEAPHTHLHQSAGNIDTTFKQPHPGLALALSNLSRNQVEWVAKLNQNLAREAAGMYAYQSQLKNTVQEFHDVIKGLDHETMQGDLIPPKSQAGTAAASIRFGPDNSDYIFILDTEYKILVHPTASLVGKNMKEHKDPNGKALFREMVDTALSKGEGFVTYYWPKVNGDKPVPKITYVKLYEPWGWVICAGIFIDLKNEALVKRFQEFDKGKPFSLGIQVDPTKCSLARFLGSPEANEYRQTFPAFRKAMEDLDVPHRMLHASAVHIENAVNNVNMHLALSIFEKETIPSLKDLMKYLEEAIEAERTLEKGFADANHIYANETKPNLVLVQSLLGKMNETVKKNIMTDDVMINSAQGTQRNVIILGGAAIVLGIILAWFISRGLVRALTYMADGIGANSDQVASASGQVSQAGQSLAEGASEQAASLEETSSSLEEMSSMTRQNADNASQANALMEETRGVVTKAETSMKEMTLSMTEISDSGQEISKIIKTIDEIAFQTNLLALNAAVEAARAGEAGAGFAVVADEVRNLAQRAATAAKTTADLIEGTISKIDQGSKLVDEVSEAFSDVAVNANKVAELVGEIAAASSEQSQGIEQINQAMSQLDQVTQRNAANAEESASASEEMNAQAENMQDMVGQLLALVGRAQKELPRAIGAAKKVTARKPQLPAPQRERAQAPARAQQKPRTKEVKPDDIIPFDDDFKDF